MIEICAQCIAHTHSHTRIHAHAYACTHKHTQTTINHTHEKEKEPKDFNPPGQDKNMLKLGSWGRWFDCKSTHYNVEAYQAVQDVGMSKPKKKKSRSS